MFINYLADFLKNHIFAATLESSLVMKAPDLYTIPLKSFNEGTRIIEFELTRDFFQSFENELIGDCSIHETVIVEKRSNLFILHFSHEGHVKTNCDRCLEPIKIPVEGEGQFVLKFVEEVQDEEEDVIYLSRDEDKFDLAPLINELVTLSLPIVKVYNCEDEEDAPCNREVLKYLNRQEPSRSESQIWEQLKNLKLED